MSNPYGKSTVRVMSDSGAPAAGIDGVRGGIITPDGTVRASAGAAFGANGEINASSTRDLMRQHAFIMAQSAAKTRIQLDPESRKASLDTLRTAFADRKGDSMQKLGDYVADAIQQTMRRHGFSRRLLVEDKADGPVIVVRLSKMDVTAQVVFDKETVVTQDVRAYWITPPEFSLDTVITISSKDLAQVGTDLMDEKFNDGLVAIWTREDQLTRQMLLNTQGLYNTPFGFSTFTPSTLSAMKNQVDSWGLNSTSLLMSFDIWNDIIGGNDFQDFFSPLEKHDLALEGRLGRLMGMEIMTDGYQYDTLRVLQPGEVFVLSAPGTLGKIVQRQPLEAMAIDQRVNGVFARGWALEQIQAQCVGNAMGVSYASRI